VNIDPHVDEESPSRFDIVRDTPEKPDYLLTLFVAGASEMSARAIGNVRSICEQHLAGRYQLGVVDIHRDATLMRQYDVVAAPTLVRVSPLPKRMLVGDLSDTARVLATLDIVTPALLREGRPGA
jgi:circadian clock protein KaiB